MKQRLRYLLFAPILAWSLALADSAAPLEPVGVIPLPRVRGRIDHLDLDAANERLFVAALGNDTVEIIDLKLRWRTQSLSGFGEPQGVVFVPALGRVIIASGSANRVDLLDGLSLVLFKRLAGLEDADNVRYDAKSERVYVGYASGALRILDVHTGDSLGDIPLAGHPESFQLERDGGRIFVNVPTAGHIAVVDRQAGKVVATWPLHGAAANFPMALDESGHRLYIGTRKPAALLIYDTGSGKLVDRVAIGDDPDDLFFDASRMRIYAICGEGVISVVASTDKDHFSVVGKIFTRAGARTGLFDPDSRRLFVAVPANERSTAEIRIYKAH